MDADVRLCRAKKKNRFTKSGWHAGIFNKKDNLKNREFARQDNLDANLNTYRHVVVTVVNENRQKTTEKHNGKHEVEIVVSFKYELH